MIVNVEINQETYSVFTEAYIGKSGLKDTTSSSSSSQEFLCKLLQKFHTKTEFIIKISYFPNFQQLADSTEMVVTRQKVVQLHSTRWNKYMYMSL